MVMFHCHVSFRGCIFSETATLPVKIDWLVHMINFLFGQKMATQENWRIFWMSREKSTSKLAKNSTPPPLHSPLIQSSVPTCTRQSHPGGLDVVVAKARRPALQLATTCCQGSGGWVQRPTHHGWSTYPHPGPRKPLSK